MKTVALVTCSVRRPRLNPFITTYVHQILTRNKPSNGTDVRLETLDLADQNLPLATDEPAIPAHLPAADPTPHYATESVRAWSAQVARYDAFIFVTPQYNWSIPASLKNALDYLYYEWKGKPAGIVSYGGRGGGKAVDSLRTILTGLRMRPVVTAPGLLTETTQAEQSVQEGRLGEGYPGAWSRAGVDDRIAQMWEELLSELRA